MRNMEQRTLSLYVVGPDIADQMEKVKMMYTTRQKFRLENSNF